VLPDSFVYKILEDDEPYIIERIAEGDLFKDSRFARDEGIVSCVAITLKAARQKVGVMFVNYRTLHRLTSEESTDIKLFADQAAIAIRNAQLFEDAKKLREQEVLKCWPSYPRNYLAR
jgi:GAF domain-containing protein